ncbi:YggT family protein [Microcella pacifica]|jgi:YggT family protein|uniref:YggT family protein n=1 Tax=Microcella pacifica TaxID=2591847 RepID=A0A9E5JLX4_9MICO|nr:YggT family protein [Microcella pacifica]NHF63010.1 YggT family protein [Microcella pacifica]
MTVPIVFSVILNIIYVALLIVFIAMWGRFVLDWIQALNRGWRPQGAVVILAEVVYTITDPPIRLVRRVIPPLQIGSIRLDFAWTIVLIVLLILMSLVSAR